jgi:hypothetical protein
MVQADPNCKKCRGSGFIEKKGTRSDCKKCKAPKKEKKPKKDKKEKKKKN